MAPGNASGRPRDAPPGVSPGEKKLRRTAQTAQTAQTALRRTALNQQPYLKPDGIISFGHDFDPPAGRFRLGECSKRRNHVTAISGRDYRHDFRGPCGKAWLGKAWGKPGEGSSTRLSRGVPGGGETGPPRRGPAGRRKLVLRDARMNRFHRTEVVPSQTLSMGVIMSRMPRAVSRVCELK